jgi:hypothetical protein
MVPDVAANADPNTGYNLVVHGTPASYGGTSAVAPLYAGLFAALGRKLAPISQRVWDNVDCFTDIVIGENGEYQAAVGPDPCTGLGVPIGTKLAALFTSGAPQARAQAPAMAAGDGFIPVPFDRALALQYALFVKAAYSMYLADPNNLRPEPTADFPAGYRLAAWVQMQDFVLSSTGPTFYGFIAQSTVDPSRYVLAIRGTETVEEWWDNLTSIISTPFSVPGCGSVASGFDRIYQTMEIVERPTGAAGSAVAQRSLRGLGSFARQAAALIGRLTAASASRVAGVPAQASVTVVGHSLGGALATLYTMENAHGDNIHNPTICTLASPRVGDATFAAAFAALPLTSWRIFNAPDLVPMLPPKIAGFTHVGIAQRFDSKSIVKADIACWHVLGTYLSLLDPTRAPDPGCGLATGAAVADARAAVMRPRGVGPSNDAGQIATLLSIAADSSQLQDAQAKAAMLLYAYDGEQYPSDGCAITLSVLLQEAGIDIADTYQAIVLGEVLKRRGWTQIPLGSQAAGDVGSTCGQTAHHGTDHIYLVLRPVNQDEMVVADNQAPDPHFRYASGKGKSPTRFFLRAP